MLGEQVRNIRKSRGFTLKALAEQTGLSIWLYIPDRAQSDGPIPVNASQNQRCSGCSHLSFYGRSRS